MILQRKSINMIEKILLTYYFNAETKNEMLNIYSKLFGHLHDLAHLTSQVISSNYRTNIISFASELREYYHFFKKYYIEYNLEMKDTFPIIYQKNKFIKLRGKWIESLFDSEYCSDLRSDWHVQDSGTAAHTGHRHINSDSDLPYWQYNR